MHRIRRRRSRTGQACRLTSPYRFDEWPCEWYPLSVYPCVSCVVAVLGFPLFANCMYIKAFDFFVVSGYRFFSICIRAFRMRLLKSIHDEIGNSSFACWFCLDFLVEIAVQTTRSKGTHKHDRRKMVCRIFEGQKHIYAYS